MKTDREFLELAAKSAGNVVAQYGIAENAPFWDVTDESNHKPWNPLQDDGDALRLRNKLRMDVFYTDQGVNVAYDDALLAFEPWGSDDCDTERRAINRAITRAAAQMQLNKE